VLFSGVARGAQPNTSWQAEWEKTVVAAKKEGTVSVYACCAVPAALLNAGVFEKAHPGIKVVGVSGRAGLAERIMAERRAGKFLADVVIHGVTPNYTELYRAKIIAPIKPVLILPEVVDESKWWEGKHRYSDPEGGYVFVHLGTPGGASVSYNTRLADPVEFKSFWDILHPRWKGKILMRDIRGSPGRGSVDMIFLYHNPDIGPEFIRRLLADMDITVFRDIRQGTDWLGRGKFPICFFCYDIDRAKAQGLPVEEFGTLKEGASLSPSWGSMVLMNRAPHPNAARVFINWYLSREGQIAVQRIAAEEGSNPPNSLREDIPKDVLRPGDRRVKGIKYLDLSRPELVNMEPVFKLMDEALREGGRKQNER
jgi:iron(III) transport system substrate-binding protein